MPSPEEIFNGLHRLHHGSDWKKSNDGIVVVEEDRIGGQEIFDRNSEFNKNYDSDKPINFTQQQHFDISNHGRITMNRNNMNFSSEQETLNGSFPAVGMTMHGSSTRGVSYLPLSSSLRSQETQFMVNPATSNKTSNFGVGEKGMKDLVASAKKFPMKLMIVLSIEEFEPIISWDALGVSFTIHDADRLSKEVLPKFFKGVKYSSFLRKLYRWGFGKRRETSGKKVRDLSYSNPRFRRGNIDLCKTILCECDESKRTDIAGQLHRQNGVASQRSPIAQENVDGFGASLPTGMIGDGLNGEQTVMIQPTIASHSSEMPPINNNNMNVMSMNRDGLNGEQIYYMIPLSSNSKAMPPPNNHSNNINMNMMRAVANRDGLNGEQAMIMQPNLASRSSVMPPHNNNSMNMMRVNRQAMIMQPTIASHSSAMPPLNDNSMNTMSMNRDGLNGEQTVMIQPNIASYSSAMPPHNSSNMNMMSMNRDGLNAEKEVYYMIPLSSYSSAIPYTNNLSMAMARDREYHRNNPDGSTPSLRSIPRRVIPHDSIQYHPEPTFNGQSFTVDQKSRSAHSMSTLPVQVSRPCLEQQIRPMQTMRNTAVPPFQHQIQERDNGEQMNMQLKMQRQEKTDPSFK